MVPVFGWKNPDWVGYTKSGLGWIYQIRIGLHIPNPDWVGYIPNPDWVGYTNSGLGWIYQIRIGLDKTKSGFSFFHLDPYPAYHNPKLITLKRIQNTLFINKGHAKNGFSQENSSSGEENSSSGEENSSSGEKNSSSEEENSKL